mmetsp:Transcript_16792/g.21248  ORF Transcript_16792/g.21248 Transcript_16792/m.21248 type:complete len:128 (+) Transcript_16792:73-456(+)
MLCKRLGELEDGAIDKSAAEGNGHNQDGYDLDWETILEPQAKPHIAKIHTKRLGAMETFLERKTMQEKRKVDPKIVTMPLAAIESFIEQNEEMRAALYPVTKTADPNEEIKDQIYKGRVAYSLQCYR